MPVAKKASAVPRKAAVAKTAPPTVDLISVRMTALNYARSLWGGAGGDVPGDPVTTAPKIVTQAKRFERYILGTDAGDDA